MKEKYTGCIHFTDIDEIVYLVNGKFHRIEGPAVISKHVEQWYRRGRLYRTDGPAVVYKGECRKKFDDEYWIKDCPLSEEKYKEWRRYALLDSFLDEEED